MTTDPKPLHERLREQVDAPTGGFTHAARLMLEAATALEEQAAAAARSEPSGYAYRYPALYTEGTVIRFTHGEEWNGVRPIESVPYWFGAAPAAAQGVQPATWRVIAAEILTVVDELARRGEMFPQNADYHRENKAAFRRVAEVLEWFDGRGHAPKLYAAPQMLDGEGK